MFSKLLTYFFFLLETKVIDMGLICIRVFCARRIGDVEARRVVRDRREFNAPYTLIATVVSNVYFMSDIHTELQQQSL